MKILGGILLIVGTSIGGALLVLPVTNAPAGLLYSCLTMLAIWLLTLFTSLLMLEINLWLPANSHLVSMAKLTLGKTGAIITWICYLLLLYSLLSAYIAGGANVVSEFFGLLNFHLSTSLSATIFTIIFGLIVYKGISAVDHLNRVLMFFKLSAYLLLVLFIFPHVKFNLLNGGDSHYVAGGIMYIVVSFGFAVIIPSLRSYFKDNIKQLKLVIIIGTFIPLLCYIVWTLIIMGIIPRTGNDSLMVMLLKNYQPIDLVFSLENNLHINNITNIAHFFISICILTAFLGVSLCLVDFLADGLKIKKNSNQGLFIYALTFIPPLMVTIVEPDAFRISLRYAGIICVILLILLPIAMVSSGRYIKSLSSSNYQVFGGKITLSLASIVAFILLIISIWQIFAPSF